MLKIKILIIIFCCIGVVKAQTVIPPSSETPPGWIYYDGDEFNGDVIDSRYWGIYGSPKVGRPTYNQENKAMLQTYRPEQVFIETLPTGEKICRIRSFKMISKIYEFTEEICGADKVILYAVPKAKNFYEKNGFTVFPPFMLQSESRFLEGCIPMYLDL